MLNAAASTTWKPTITATVASRSRSFRGGDRILRLLLFGDAEEREGAQVDREDARQPHVDRTRL